MTSLPFELHKRHKSTTKANWKFRGMKIDPDDFDYIYNEYTHATNCDLCNNQFKNSIDRHLDHNHETGEVRNIVCCKCNNHKEDKLINTNKTGERFISKCKTKKYKSGYCFKIQIIRNKKNITDTSRKSLEEAIKFRDEFLKNNPTIFT